MSVENRGRSRPSLDTKAEVIRGAFGVVVSFIRSTSHRVGCELSMRTASSDYPGESLEIAGYLFVERTATDVVGSEVLLHGEVTELKAIRNFRDDPDV